MCSLLSFGSVSPFASACWMLVSPPLSVRCEFLLPLPDRYMTPSCLCLLVCVLTHRCLLSLCAFLPLLVGCQSLSVSTCWVSLYLPVHVRCLTVPVGYLLLQQLGWHEAFPLWAYREYQGGLEGSPQALGREEEREHGEGGGPGLGNHRPRMIGCLGPAQPMRPHPAHPPWGRPPLQQPRRLLVPAMVLWPCWADGAGSQAAPIAALGPAPLAAQEAAAQDRPDLSACPWPWLWSPAGLGKCVQISSPGLVVALGTGAQAAGLA